MPASAPAIAMPFRQPESCARLGDLGGINRDGEGDGWFCEVDCFGLSSGKSSENVV